jgi:hypothetical protein
MVVLDGNGGEIGIPLSVVVTSAVEGRVRVLANAVVNEADADVEAVPKNPEELAVAEGSRLVIETLINGSVVIGEVNVKLVIASARVLSSAVQCLMAMMRACCRWFRYRNNQVKLGIKNTSISGIKVI